jgi:hypothetical protein
MSMVKVSIGVSHGNIKMIPSIPMFGKFYTMIDFLVFRSIRYTSSSDGQSIYAFLLVWPNDTTEILLGAPVPQSNTSVVLLGEHTGSLQWRSTNETSGLIIDVSIIQTKSIVSRWASVFKLQNIIVRNTMNIITSNRYE